MKAKTGEYIAVHRDPVWRESANFLFHAHMGVEAGKNEWEQLWGKVTAPNRVVLCCIPFFLYDVALGDEVLLTPDNVLAEVVHRSGQVTFRVWFGEQDRANRKDSLKEIEAMKPLMEWSSENLLALSVPEDEAQRMANYLQLRETEGVLQYETGRR